MSDEAPCRRCGFYASGHEPPFASSDHAHEPSDKCPCGVWMTRSHEEAHGARHRAIVEAVRADRCVGRGSCTSVDETLEDAELLEVLGDCSSPQDAVAKARRMEVQWLDRALDAEADWARDAKREFEARCVANPLVSPMRVVNPGRSGRS